MESFVSAIRGELEIRAVVLWDRKPFSADCREVDDDWKRSSSNYELRETTADPAAVEGVDISLSVIHRERIHLKDNTMLGDRLKHHSLYNSGSHILLVPPGMEIDDSDLIPVLRNLHDHVAIMRGGSAVLLNPTAHFDLKIDDQCYIIIPPNLVYKYADNAPEPLHLVLYILAIIVTAAVLLGIFYRTRRKREDGERINLVTF